MKVKSDGGTKQHHYTTKSITIPYVPDGKSRDRAGAEGARRKPHARGHGKFLPGGLINTRQCPLLKQGESPPKQMHPGAGRGDI